MLRQFESLLLAPDRDRLAASLRRAVHAIGFESFYYGAQARSVTARAGSAFDVADLSSPRILTDYSSQWAQRYGEAGYASIDPMVQECSRSMIPIIWHRHPSVPDKGKDRLFDEARQHGLATCMTCSIIGGPGELALLSLTMENDRQADRRTVERQASQGHMLMSYLHESLRRLDRQAAQAAPAVRLTAREKEILTWVSAGKTSWEIACILAVAERTVIFHVDNAMRKLDTRSRTQAVAKALALGLIAP